MTTLELYAAMFDCKPWQVERELTLEELQDLVARDDPETAAQYRERIINR
jgi:hypothetical protein